MGAPPQYIPPCKVYTPEIPNNLHYQPSLAAGIVFCILFGLSTVLHLYQTIRYKKIWQLSFVLAGVTETIGWVARTVMHTRAYSQPLNTMQIAVLIIGPGWTVVGIWITAWLLIRLIGGHVSPVPPTIYLWTTACLDTICFALQATGGGLAGAAFDSGDSTQPGTTTMVAGIIAQLVSICIFAVFFAVVIKRGLASIVNVRSMQLLCIATCVSVTFMIIRGMYRSIELLQGWRGYLITTERYFIALDGVMMLLALAVFNVWNPGKLFMEAKATIRTRNGAKSADIEKAAPDFAVDDDEGKEILVRKPSV